MNTYASTLLLLWISSAWILAEPSPNNISDPLVTYHKHIAPLFYEKCVSCHRPGEAAPFSLLDYASAKRRSKTIARVISTRYMPPWKPVTGHGDFKQNLSLTNPEIDLIQTWVKAGCPEGDASKKTQPPTFTKGWQLGTPDLIVEMQQSFEIYAEGRDIYRYFALPLGLEKDQWVRAVEIRPSARSVVHHALFFLDNTGKARQLQQKDPKPGFNGKGFKSTGSLGAWAVGGMPLALDDGFALPLPKGSDLVLQTHFHPSGKLEKEKTKVGIYFAKQEPKRKIGEFQIPPHFGAQVGLTIAPDDSHYVIQDHLTVPEDLELITVWAHAHQIARSMKADATLPNGKKLPLFYIDDWDFNWQGQYQYQKPVLLPKGTRIDVTIIYDNSAHNINNPNSPPQRIHWGEASDDEMGSIIFQCVASDKKQENTLARGLQRESKKSKQRFAKARQMMRRLHTVLILDKNHDDQLSLAETPKKHHQTFHRLDLNKNQIVEVDEIKQAGSFLDKK
ncbi:MAG: hypothetical protein L3J39_19120 [Verrucomicrobiales bacterium]|nr:hypothetical protein [Verrucomicrobiales bacterium]